jgi:hypothetical protein
LGGGPPGPPAGETPAPQVESLQSASTHSTHLRVEMSGKERSAIVKVRFIWGVSESPYP